jgi:hypothetical protein
MAKHNDRLPDPVVIQFFNHFISANVGFSNIIPERS